MRGPTFEQQQQQQERVLRLRLTCSLDMQGNEGLRGILQLP